MARGTPFPHEVGEFDQDDRISYDTQEQKWLLVDDSNEEWEFSEATKSWFQPATEEQIAAYQQAYGADAEDEPPAAAPTQAEKKRKRPAVNDGNSKKPKVQENRAIYITNLPLDATTSEIDEEFSKYGMIDQGLDGQKRIKMYADDNGDFKGEAMVVYFKKESVGMAVRMMDDSWFRPGEPATIKVQEADMSFKKSKDGHEVKQNMVRRDKKANERTRAEMNRKLAEWSDDDEEVTTKTFAPPTNKYSKIVLVRHAFTLELLKSDIDAYGDIKEDMEDEAKTFGEITNVVLYDREPDGILSVKFKEADAAEKFKERIHGRNYDGRKLVAEIAIERPKFKKSGTGTASDEEEEAERLERFVTGGSKREGKRED